jgi:hypothetical protein
MKSSVYCILIYPEVFPLGNPGGSCSNFISIVITPINATLNDSIDLILE